MPIKPEFRHFYGKEWREITRPRILARACNACERCNVPNGARVLRACGWWTPRISCWFGIPTVFAHWMSPDRIDRGEHGFPSMICREVRIVLTIAHLNHTPGDDRDENLQALCQWCHLTNDFSHHKQSRAIRKDLARPLLVPMAVSPTIQ